MHHTHFAVHTAEEPQSVLINSEGDSYRTLDIWPAVMALPPAQEITRLLTCFFFDPNFCDRELSKDTKCLEGSRSFEEISNSQT
jgi:hypothetical protein